MIAAEKPSHVFSVTIMPSGDIQLDGIKPNEIYMLGLLEKVKEILKDFYKAQESRITKHNGSIQVNLVQ